MEFKGASGVGRRILGVARQTMRHRDVEGNGFSRATALKSLWAL